MSDYSQPPSQLGPGIELVEGLANWLRGIGVRAGFVPVQWPHEQRPGLIWRMPDPDIRAASILSGVQGILVREYERAVVLRNGVFYAELPAGVYDIRKVPLKDFIEVVFVSTQMTQHKWGVGRLINRENITVGAHGFIFLEVVDARQFVTRVVAGNRKYTQQELEDWVFGIVAGVMRTQLATSAIMDMMQEQESFARACGNRLSEAFGEWGIGFKNLVVNQFDIPQEYRDTIAQVTMARFDGQRKLISAEAEAQSLRIQSQAEAAARLTTGAAEVELLARMQALGLDPIRLKAIEALTQYSQLAAATGGGSDSGSDMMSMMLFMQMSRLLTDPGMPPEAKIMLQAQYPQAAMQVGQLQSPPPGAPIQPAPPLTPEATPVEPASAPPPAPRAEETGDGERKRIQKILDDLDERLAAGEVSEATYYQLRTKWEKKLADLGA